MSDTLLKQLLGTQAHRNVLARDNKDLRVQLAASEAERERLTEALADTLVAMRLAEDDMDTMASCITDYQHDMQRIKKLTNSIAEAQAALEAARE
jgi:hypothetical protein